MVAQVSTSSARRERMFIEQRLKNVERDLDSAAKQFSEYASKNTAIDITAQGKAMLEAAATLEWERIPVQSELHKFGGLDSSPASSDSSSQPQFPTIRQLPLLGVRCADLYRRTKIKRRCTNC